MNFLFFTIIALVIGIIADLISKNGFVAIVAAIIVIIPELSEPPVRTLGATIPENESHIFR